MSRSPPSHRPPPPWRTLLAHNDILSRARLLDLGEGRMALRLEMSVSLRATG